MDHSLLQAGIEIFLAFGDQLIDNVLSVHGVGSSFTDRTSSEKCFGHFFLLVCFLVNWLDVGVYLPGVDWLVTARALSHTRRMTNCILTVKLNISIMTPSERGLSGYLSGQDHRMWFVGLKIVYVIW